MGKYQHQSWNHLVFDKVRSIQLDIEFLKAYLMANDFASADPRHQSEIQALQECSTLLFDDVYKSLREKWL